MIALLHGLSPALDRCERTFIPHEAIDWAQANRQHTGYRVALEALGVDVRILTMNLPYPDSVFLEDTAVVLNEVAIIASMGAASRQAEPDAVARVLSEYRRLEPIEPPATLEGGDVLRVGRTLLVGLSGRTNARGIESLAAIAGRMGYRVESVSVRGCLHLKTACTALPDDRLLVNRTWLDVSPLRDFGLIDIPPDEPWSANVVTVGTHVLLPLAHQKTAALVEQLGFAVRAVDISEFAKAEGGVTCLSIMLGG